MSGDNTPIKKGTGSDLISVASDERIINSETVQVQRMVGVGNTEIANGQVTIDDTVGGTVIVESRDTRNSILIINRGFVNVFIGSGTVSSSNGLELYPNEGVVLNTTGQIKAITSSASASVHYVEEYDN